MITITGGKCNTITLAAGEIYALALVQGCHLDIANASTGTLYISEKNDFTETDGVGKYVSIPQGCSYDSFPLERSSTLYMKAAGSGTASIVMRRWR